MLRGMKIAAAVAGLSLALSSPASATYFDWSQSVTVNSYATGMNFVVDYYGIANNSWTSKLSAVASYTFTGLSNNGKTYNFNYSITNDSPYDSRIRAFGFDTSADPSTITSTGTFTYGYENVSFPYTGSLDVCFAAGSGCTDHSSGGINDGATGKGSFSLTFANAMESIDFEHFALKFISVNPTINGSDWGIGAGQISSITAGAGAPITAPEPGTWLMMLGGFGFIGFAMRRRRTGGEMLQAV
jgi:hypothetical protein